MGSSLSRAEMRSECACLQQFQHVRGGGPIVGMTERAQRAVQGPACCKGGEEARPRHCLPPEPRKARKVASVGRVVKQLPGVADLDERMHRPAWMGEERDAQALRAEHHEV